MVMRKTIKRKPSITAERIAKMADQGKDVSSFFTNKGKMMPPSQRVNVDQLNRVGPRTLHK